MAKEKIKVIENNIKITEIKKDKEDSEEEKSLEELASGDETAPVSSGSSPLIVQTNETRQETREPVKDFRVSDNSTTIKNENTNVNPYTAVNIDNWANSEKVYTVAGQGRPSASLMKQFRLREGNAFESPELKRLRGEEDDRTDYKVRVEASKEEKKRRMPWEA